VALEPDSPASGVVSWPAAAAAWFRWGEVSRAGVVPGPGPPASPAPAPRLRVPQRDVRVPRPRRPGPRGCPPPQDRAARLPAGTARNRGPCRRAGRRTHAAARGGRGPVGGRPERAAVRHRETARG